MGQCNKYMCHNINSSHLLPFCKCFRQLFDNKFVVGTYVGSLKYRHLNLVRFLF